MKKLKDVLFGALTGILHVILMFIVLAVVAGVFFLGFSVTMAVFGNPLVAFVIGLIAIGAILGAVGAFN